MLVRMCCRRPSGSAPLEWAVGSAVPQGTVRLSSGGTTLQAVTREVGDSGDRVQLHFGSTLSTAFEGRMFVHAAVCANPNGCTPDLHVEAHAHGSFIAALGRPVKGGFRLESAVLLQGGKALDTVLRAEVLPPPQTARRMAASLSPEQRRMAETYRALQLQAAGLVVVVIHTAPLLADVLHLVPGSLSRAPP